ncbi:MAG: hypothetical protein Q7I98_05095, partial [Erysipelotrichaceae bacterium]|nr:hypothetical protein [Erysipelotrichaceae bacterium]
MSELYYANLNLPNGQDYRFLMKRAYTELTSLDSYLWTAEKTLKDQKYRLRWKASTSNVPVNNSKSAVLI